MAPNFSHFTPLQCSTASQTSQIFLKKESGVETKIHLYVCFDVRKAFAVIDGAD